MSVDNEMMNILQNLNNVGTDKPNINPQTGAQSDAPKANDSKAMLNILESFNRVDPNGSALVAEGKLDKGQKKAGQTSADWKPKSISVLDNGKDPEHPAKGQLVGESEDEHVEEDYVGKKSGLADVLRSMEESEEDIKTRLTKEFHSKTEPKKALGKADNGKAVVAEEINARELKREIYAVLKDIASFTKQTKNESILVETLSELYDTVQYIGSPHQDPDEMFPGTNDSLDNLKIR